MKTYGEYCSVAKGLDVVGDRWTLLIVRELLILGPCRYTDIKAGVPGIASNLLVSRLAELETHGLVQRVAATATGSSQHYELTELGRGLEPVLISLARWGVHFMDAPSEGDEFRFHWFAFSVGAYWRELVGATSPQRLNVETDAGTFSCWMENGRLASGPAVPGADLTLSGRPDMMIRLLSEAISLDDAREAGLRVEGDVALLRAGV